MKTDREKKIREGILELINEELSDQKQELNENVRLVEDLNMDSLEIVSLQIAIEDRFGFEFDPLFDDFETCFKTFGSLCEYVGEKTTDR